MLVEAVLGVVHGDVSRLHAQIGIRSAGLQCRSSRDDQSDVA